MADSTMQTNILRNRAQNAMLSRDFTTAARLYRSLLKSDPRNISLLSDLASIYMKSGDDQSAIPLYKQIIHLDNSNLDAFNNLGGIYRRLKMYDESIAVLEQAVLTDSTNIQIYYNLGFTYKLMGKFQDAINCFEQVVEANQNDVLAYNHLGTIYQQTNRNDKAVQSFLRGLKVDPNHPVLHLNLAKSYELLGQKDKALLEYESALKSKPGWLEAIDSYTDLLLDKNKTREASDIVNQALRLNPKNSQLHAKMGNVYKKRYDFQNADDEYNTAISLDEKNENAYLGLAQSNELQSKKNEAIRIIEEAELINPHNDKIAQSHAHILLTAEKLNSASKKIKEIYNKNPNDVKALNLLAQYYICKGEKGKASGCFKKIESIDPEYAEHYLEGAKRYIQREEFEEAKDLTQVYLETNEESPETMRIAAEIAEKSNKLTEALEIYKEIYARDNLNIGAKNKIEIIQNKLLQTENQGLENQKLLQEQEDFSEPDFEEINLQKNDSEFEDELNKTEVEDDDFDIQLQDEKFSFERLTDEDNNIQEQVFDPEAIDDDFDNGTEAELKDDLDALIENREQPLELDNLGRSRGFGDTNYLPDRNSDSTLDDGVMDQIFESPKDVHDLNQISSDDDDEYDSTETINLDENLDDNFLSQEEEPYIPPAPKINFSNPVSVQKSNEVPPQNLQTADFTPANLLKKLENQLQDEQPVLNSQEESNEAVVEEETLPEEMITEDESEDQTADELDFESEDVFASEDIEEINEANEFNKADDSQKSLDDLFEDQEQDEFIPPQIQDEQDFEDSTEMEIFDDDFLEKESSESNEPIENLDEIFSNQEEELQPEEQQLEELQQEYNAGYTDGFVSHENLTSPANEKSTATIGQVVDAIIDKNFIAKYKLTSGTFKQLKQLSESLPQNVKEEFQSSKTSLILDYVIARLNGRPGLLATAEALRKEWNVENNKYVKNSGVVVNQVMENMKTLISNLPDKNTAANLLTAVDSTLEKLN